MDKDKRDKDAELLMDMKDDDGYYRVGDQIYTKDGEVVDSAEETAIAVSQIIKKEKGDGS